MAYYKCLYNPSRNEFETIPSVPVIIEALNWTELPDNVYSIESFNHEILDWGFKKYVLRVYYYNPFLDPQYYNKYYGNNGLSDIPSQIPTGSQIIEAEFIGYTLDAWA